MKTQESTKRVQSAQTRSATPAGNSLFPGFYLIPCISAMICRGFFLCATPALHRSRSGSAKPSILAVVAALFVGMVLGGSIRFSAHYRSGFERGRAAAIAEMRQEAVREGHGHFERDENGGPNRFAWNAVRSTEYAPDAVSRIRGLE